MATVAHEEDLELDEDAREAIFVTGGDPDNPSALDLRRAQIALMQSTQAPKQLTQHERDYRRLVGFMRSQEAAALDDLAMLLEHQDIAFDAAADPLRPHIRTAVIKGLASRDIADKVKSMNGSIKCVENNSGMGSRTEALQAIQACHAVMLLLIEVFGHAAMLDPDPHAEPDQGDIVEEARKATAPADDDEPEAPRIKPAAQVARPQAFPGGKGAALADVDAEENGRRAHEELDFAEPIYSDDAKPLAMKTWDKKRDEAFDFYEVEKWTHLPEVKRREIVAEIVERFGNVDHKAAWARIIASRDGTAGEVSNG